MVSIRRSWIAGASSLLLLLSLGACAPLSQGKRPRGKAAQRRSRALFPSLPGIPDQDLKCFSGFTLSGRLPRGRTGWSRRYKPVTDYAAAVTAFKVGDLDLVWFGGLTGCRRGFRCRGGGDRPARYRRAVPQCVHRQHASGLQEFSDSDDLAQLKGRPSPSAASRPPRAANASIYGRGGY
jgi:phosphonate transport system substrate-binding protein